MTVFLSWDLKPDGGDNPGSGAKICRGRHDTSTVRLKQGNLEQQVEIINPSYEWDENTWHKYVHQALAHGLRPSLHPGN